jgi:hypothetical protein
VRLPETQKAHFLQVIAINGGNRYSVAAALFEDVSH